MYDNIAQDSKKSEDNLLSIGKTGFIPGLFKISQIHLERNKDLYSLANSKKRGNGTSSKINETN